MKKQMTLIYYYVPEDKDDPQVPNVFGINVKKDDIRLKHLHDYFPIAGQYIFRFKVLYENNIAWLDLPDQGAKIPTFKDKIMVKASRVSWQNKSPILNKKQSTQNNPTTYPIIQKSIVEPKVTKKQQGPKSSPKQQSVNLIDDQHLNSHHTDSLL